MTICCLFSDCRKHTYNKDNDLLAVIYEAEWFSLRKKMAAILLFFCILYVRCIWIKFASVASAEIKRPFTLKQVNA